MIKRLSIFQKLIFTANILVVLLLVLSFFAPNLSAKKFPLINMIAMLTPVWLLANFIFVAYWCFIKKGIAFFSLSILFFSYFLLTPIFKFSKTDKIVSEDDLKIMTFNTRGFNKNEELEINNIDSLIVDFINEEEPDIVCFQEFYYAMKRSNALSKYKYSFIDFIYGEKLTRVIQAIYSKYPILKVKLIEFPESSNSAIYADILKGSDTLRVYNIHLQSYNIIPEVRTLKNENSNKLVKRVKKVVKLQKNQIEILNNHIANTDYKTIIVGDVNNTQFTNIYGSLKGDFQDSFLETGHGFGKTFSLKGFPMRIDYILADNSFEFTSHTNYEVEYSDHFPVMATLKLKSDKATVD